MAPKFARRKNWTNGMTKKRKPTDTFQIDFDTQSMPGKIVALEVRISSVIAETRNPGDLEKSFRIDLNDHPLYRKLFTYCMNNPPAGYAVRRNGKSDG
jgi:hypothetical protein